MARPRSLLVLLLCLWLPLQAAAGSWLPCHWLSASTEIRMDHDNAPAHQGCGSPGATQVQTKAATPDSNTCFHCAAACHFSSAVLLPDAMAELPLPLIRYTRLYLLSPDSILLDSPHRPPRHA
ncbi:MAG: hypothetical protein WA987_08640 [Cellvibrio sp.]